VAPHPAHVDLQGGERLAELVVQLARDARLLALAQVLRGESQAADVVARLAQRFLLSQALGHVAQDHREEALAVLAHLGDRGLDGELLAVAAQPLHHARGPHAARGFAGLAETAHQIVMRRAVALRDEPRQRRADGLLARADEDVLGRLVEEHDVLALVHGDDGVHGGIEDAAQARLAARQHLRGAHPLGHVAQDHGEELVAVLAVLRYRGLEGKLAAVGAQPVEHGLRRPCRARWSRCARTPRCGRDGRRGSARG
jgi:hypothetical protein